MRIKDTAKFRQTLLKNLSGIDFDFTYEDIFKIFTNIHDDCSEFEYTQIGNSYVRTLLNKPIKITNKDEKRSLYLIVTNEYVTIYKQNNSIFESEMYIDYCDFDNKTQFQMYLLLMIKSVMGDN